MPDDKDMIQRQMEATRHSLTEKLETLENKVVNTVSSAKDAVTDTIDSVKDTVSSVKGTVHETVDAVKGTVHETVHAVKGTARDTVESVKGAFDITHHVDQYPWACMGGAVALGYLGGCLLQQSGGRGPAGVLHSFGESNGTAFGRGDWADARPTPTDYGRPSAPPESHRAGWVSGLTQQFGPEIERVKGMAIGTAIGLFRDALIGAVPQQLRSGLTDILDQVTNKLGGESYRAGTFAAADTPERTTSPTGGRTAGIG
jgi:ElaB/YqjD/DUF883 family membrane-anchored ribosome-binding protein